MFACLDRGFAMLCTLCGLVLIGLWDHLLTWLHPFPFLRYTFMVLVWHPFGFLCFFTSLHACLHVLAWVYVSSILQSNVIMDIRSKPTFILVKHPLLFDNMFVCLFVCFTCLFAPIWHLLIACLLACFPFTCFSACLLACFFCHCMYTHGAWTLGARVKPPRRKQNGQGCKQGDASPQRAMFSRLGGLAPPEWFSLSLPL